MASTKRVGARTHARARAHAPARAQVPVLCKRSARSTPGRSGAGVAGRWRAPVWRGGREMEATLPVRFSQNCRRPGIAGNPRPCPAPAAFAGGPLNRFLHSVTPRFVCSGEKGGGQGREVGGGRVRAGAQPPPPEKGSDRRAGEGRTGWLRSSARRTQRQQEALAEPGAVGMAGAGESPPGP